MPTVPNTLAAKQDFQLLNQALCAEIRAGARRIVRHMYAGMLAQLASLLGFAYFFATYIR